MVPATRHGSHNGPCLAVVGDRAPIVNVGSRQPGSGVVEISATTNRVLRQVALEAPNDVETGLGSTWVTDTRASSATVAQMPSGLTRRPTRVTLARATATSPDDLAVGEGAVWATVADVLYRLDPARPGAARRIGALGRRPPGRGRRRCGRAMDRRLHSTHARPARSGQPPHNGCHPPAELCRRVVVGEGAVWVPSIQGLGVQGLAQPGASGPRDSRRGRWERRGRRRRQRLGHGAGARRRGEDRSRLRARHVDRRWKRPTDVCVSQGAVWVANSGAGTVSRIDASTGKVVDTVRVPRRPNRIAGDERSVWVTFLGALKGRARRGAPSSTM